MTGTATDDDALSETATLTISVQKPRAVLSKHLFALCDVEIDLDGLVVTICGVGARRQPDGQVAVVLPVYRDVNGQRQGAVKLPPELLPAIGESVLDTLVSVGLAVRRFGQQ